jgi:hypothetical protein
MIKKSKRPCLSCAWKTLSSVCPVELRTAKVDKCAEDAKRFTLMRGASR